MTREATLPPGPRLPVAAQSAEWILRPTQMMERLRDRHGDTFTIRLARVGPLVFISDPDDVKAVFTGSPERLHAGEANVILEPVLGSSSILLLDEERHLRQRKLMLPAFHGERLQRYRDQMREVAQAELERWPRGSREPARPRMQSITLDIIMRTVFGVEEGERMTRLRSALKELLEWTTARRRLFIVAALGPQRLGESSRLRRSPSSTPNTVRMITSSVIAWVCGRAAAGTPSGQRSSSASAIASICSR